MHEWLDTRQIGCTSMSIQAGLNCKDDTSPFLFFHSNFTPLSCHTSKMKTTTDLFGIPVPSTDGVFLTVVVIHIFISLICVISGLIAMLTEKGGTKHSFSGRVYLWAMLSALITVVMLSIMRWPHNIHLLIIGVLASASAYLGYRLTRTARKHWTMLHTVLMSSSYIFLLTGFYVDNGKNLPFWRLFPQWFFWIFPAMVGIPIMIRVLKRHPLNQRHRHG